MRIAESQKWNHKRAKTAILSWLRQQCLVF